LKLARLMKVANIAGRLVIIPCALLLGHNKTDLGMSLKGLKGDKMKFTFKKYRERYRPEYFDVKLKGKCCGAIDKSKVTDFYRIGLTIEKDEEHDNGNPNCSWMWVFFKTPNCTTAEDCKQWLNDNIELILKRYNLHMFNDS